MAGPRARLGRIASDRDSGATQIARAAAEVLGTLTGSEVHEGIRLLLQGHPTMAPLWRLATEVLSAGDPARGARTFLDHLQSDAAAASLLAPELPPWILTISYSSSVVEVIQKARISLVTCMRSEPGGEGVRMAEAVAPNRARVIEDDEAIRLVPAAAVVVGADAVSPAGLVNKVKTRALTEAARAKGVPCYAVAGDTKFVDAELPVESPFERAPLELFTAIATPDGLLSPSEAAERAAQGNIHPDLAELLTVLSA
jgi:translation initiation factor 2B subunit (eIF-2B alpha/beta/delta family)